MTKRNHQPGKLVSGSLKNLKNGWHADGGNLYLLVRGESRSWVLRYTSNSGTRRNMGLGKLSDISLARAREIARINLSKINDIEVNFDPIEIKKQNKLAQLIKKRKESTFKECAEKYIAINEPSWKNSKHVQQWQRTLETYAYPHFGNMPVEKIDTALVTKCLSDIWLTKTETATRIRGRIESILDWARVSGLRAGDNPARWRGHLDKILAPPAKITKIKHHSALKYIETGEFIAQLKLQKGLSAKALLLCILTGTRSGEIRNAKWDEINIENRIWTIPGERMKAGKEHRIPLSSQAIDILKDLPIVENSEFIFPNSKVTGVISDMALLTLLRRMKRSDITIHGFRSTFRDWIAEQTNYSNEVAEMALAHTVGSKVEAAYRRGDLFMKRVNLMQDWGDYCSVIQQKSTLQDRKVLHLIKVA